LGKYGRVLINCIAIVKAVWGLRSRAEPWWGLGCEAPESFDVLVIWKATKRLKKT